MRGWLIPVLMRLSLPALVVLSAPISARSVLDDFIMRGIAALDKDRIVVCGDSGRIFRSGDGGTTWNPQPTGTPEHLRGIASSGDGALYAVGKKGTILGARDGTPWTPLAAGTRSDLFAVAALPGGIAFATGDSGTLLKTGDGGATWVRKATPTGYGLVSLSIVDAHTAFAATDGDSILKTTDGGDTWTRHYVGTIVGHPGLVGLSGVAAAGRDTLFASAIDTRQGFGQAALFRSLDGGLSWSKTDSTGTMLLYCVAAWNGTTALAAGGLGYIFRTRPDGASWENRQWAYKDMDHHHQLLAIAFADARTAFATGDMGSVYRTTDGGNSWQETPLPTSIHAVYRDGGDPPRLENGILRVAAGRDGLLSLRAMALDGRPAWERRLNGPANQMQAVSLLPVPAGFYVLDIERNHARTRRLIRLP